MGAPAANCCAFVHGDAGGDGAVLQREYLEQLVQRHDLSAKSKAFSVAAHPEGNLDCQRYKQHDRRRGRRQGSPGGIREICDHCGGDAAGALYLSVSPEIFCDWNDGRCGKRINSLMEGMT